MAKMLPLLSSAECIKRCESNPVLAPKDIPYASEAVFNAAVVKRNGKYTMLFRNDYNWIPEKKWFAEGDSTVLGLADSDDGINWTVRPEPFKAINKLLNDDNIRAYDPRITIIEGEMYLTFALETRHGIRGGIAKIIGDFEDVEFISASVPDNRNMVLFPEKINGKYVRLERPFPVYGRGGVDRFDIWISFSKDLIYWGESQLLAAVEDFPFANDKIGPAAPPIKTDAGWLVITHTVDKDESRGKNGWEDVWKKRYCAAVMLLDLDDPTKVLGIYKKPLIAPETVEEVDEGFRTNVIFPCACIEEDGGILKIYYGASDMVTNLAEAKIQDLIDLCLSNE